MKPSKTNELPTVGVLGLGAIGAKVGAVLLAAGHRVSVWNRSADRAERLRAEGAVVADSAAAAAESELVLLCLTDHRAAREVLTVIGAGLTGRTVVTLTTGSAADAQATAELVTAAGGSYLDAGLQAGPELIGTEQATLFYSGPREVFDGYRATLELLGATHYVGSAVGAAAIQDLALFGLWYDAQLGYLRALETVRAAGIDLESFAASAATQLGHVVHGTGEAVRELRGKSYPRGPATLAEHAPVLDELIALRGTQALGTGGLERVRELLRDRVTSGHGDEGLTSLLAE